MNGIRLADLNNFIWYKQIIVSVELFRIMAGMSVYKDPEPEEWYEIQIPNVVDDIFECWVTRYDNDEGLVTILRR